MRKCIAGHTHTEIPQYSGKLESNNYDGNTSVFTLNISAHDESFKDIEHSLDIWHKSGKIAAKLLEAARLRGNNILFEWVAPIRNHFWHASQTCGGNVEVLKVQFINF
jgi:hypothetical protein